MKTELNEIRKRMNVSAHIKYVRSENYHEYIVDSSFTQYIWAHHLSDIAKLFHYRKHIQFRGGNISTLNYNVKWELHYSKVACNLMEPIWFNKKTCKIVWQHEKAKRWLKNKFFIDNGTKHELLFKIVHISKMRWKSSM